MKKGLFLGVLFSLPVSFMNTAYLFLHYTIIHKTPQHRDSAFFVLQPQE